MSNKFLIGADPEIFLLRNNNYLSVIGLIGGDKWNPIPISEVGHAILEDNVAVEFNIPPCSSVTEFKEAIHFTMNKIKERIPNINFSQESAVSFPVSELNCEAAWLFGCEPDYNAWTNEKNPKPEAPDITLRSCGGHIHVGSDIAINRPTDVIKAMDLFLGVPSVILDTKGHLRRSLYGKPGAYRAKPYGVEYRTLSNFWIFSDDTIAWAYEGTQRALEFVESGKTIKQEDEKLIQECINTGNKDLYEHLARSY